MKTSGLAHASSLKANTNMYAPTRSETQMEVTSVKVQDPVSAQAVVRRSNEGISFAANHRCNRYAAMRTPKTISTRVRNEVRALKTLNLLS